MQIVNEAKERVCLSLLNQVSACERLLVAAEQKDNNQIPNERSSEATERIKKPTPLHLTYSNISTLNN